MNRNNNNNNNNNNENNENRNRTNDNEEDEENEDVEFYDYDEDDYDEDMMEYEGHLDEYPLENLEDMLAEGGYDDDDDDEDYTNEEAISDNEEEEEEEEGEGQGEGATYMDRIINYFNLNRGGPGKSKKKPKENKITEVQQDDDMNGYTHPLDALNNETNTFRSMVMNPANFTFQETLKPAFINYICHSDGFILERYLQKLKIHWLTLNGKNRFEEIKESQRVSTCGLVFKHGDWGYHCDTCCLDTTSIYCQACFKNSDHKGHEFRASRTGAGGCCDCGDKDSILESGFCTKHQDFVESDEDLYAILNKISPNNVEEISKILGQILDTIIGMLSKKPKASQSDRYSYYTMSKESNVGKADNWAVVIYNDNDHSFEDVINCLRDSVPKISPSHPLNYAHYVHMNDRCVVFSGTKEEASKVALDIANATHTNTDTPLKTTITQRYLLFPIFNLKLILEFFQDITQLSCFRRIFCNLLRLPVGEYKRSNNNNNNNDYNIEHSSPRLSTIFNRISRLPDSSIPLLRDWLFSLSFDRSFKLDFSRCFLKSYPKIVASFLKDIYGYDMSLFVLTVQIFTIPNLAIALSQKYNALDVIFDSITAMIPTYNITNNNQLTPESSFRIEARKEYKKFQHMINDYHHTLSIAPILKSQLADGNSKYLEDWLSLLSIFHLSDPNVRSTTVFSENLYCNLFFTESFSLLRYTHNIVDSLTPATPLNATDDEKKAIVRAMEVTLGVLKALRSECTPDPKGISFHIPVHRTIVSLCQNLLSNFNLPLSTFESLWSDKHQLSDKILSGPARIDNLVSESAAKMWMKNGESIANQIYNYSTHTYLRCYFTDPDLFLKQISLSIKSETHQSFIKDYFKYFDSISTLFKNSTKSAFSNYQVGVLSNFINNLLYIFTERSNVGQVSQTDIIENDIIHSLIHQPLVHSKLINTIIPESRRLKEITREEFEKVLKKVSNYVSPSSINDQGKYALKPEFYPRYNKYYFRYPGSDREKAEETLNGMPQYANRKLRIPKLSALKPEFNSIRSVLLHDDLFEVIYYSLYQCVTTGLPESSTLDESDIQQRVIERSDIIGHITYLLYLIIDEHPNSHSEISEKLLKIIDPVENKSILDLVLEVYKDSSKSYFHPTLREILQVLSKESISLVEALKLKLPDNSIIDGGRESLSTSAEAGSLTDEEKRRKAQEARKNILMKLQKDQSNFKHSIDMSLDDEDVEMEDDEYSSVIKGTCILCLESTPINDKNKPLGTLCNIQYSRLTQLMKNRESQNLNPEYYYVLDHSKANAEPNKKKLYVGEDDSLDQSNDTSDKTNLFIKNCGHLIHLHCFEKLYQSSNSFVNCPLCGVFSNALLPNEIKGFSPVSKTAESNSTVTKQSFMKDIENSKLKSLYSDFKDRIQNKLKSIKNTNSPVENRPTPTSHLVSSTITLLEFQARSVDKLLSSFIDYKQVQSLKSLFDSVSVLQVFENTPTNTDDEITKLLSFMEPFNYLIHLIISKATPLTNYKTLIQELIDQVIMRSINSVVTKSSYMPPIGSSSQCPNDIRSLLESMYLKAIDNQNSTDKSTTVTSNITSSFIDAIWNKVNSEMVVFLRKLSILEAIYFNTTLPSFELKNDSLSTYADQLLDHLGIGASMVQIVSPHLFDVKYQSDAPLANSAARFELIELPELYEEFMDLSIKCIRCKKVPNTHEQVICLTCGRMICIANCCKRGGIGEASSHSQKCAGDQGVFLMMDQCVIILVYDGIIGTLSSPYLDAHGEEDRGLKRGVPLHFVKERYQFLANSVVKQDILVSKSNLLNIRNQI